MKRSVVINGRSLARKIGGVERFTRELIRFWPGELRQVRPPASVQGWRGHLWEQVNLPLQLARGELLLSPANTGPILVPDQVLCLCDVSPLEHPEWFAPAFRWWYRLLLPALVRRVRGVITISEFSRQQIQEIFKLPEDRISVVPCGVDRTRFRPVPASEAESIRRDLEVDGNYILFVGSNNPRKNEARLLEAWESFQPRHPGYTLIFAGPTSANFKQDPVESSPQGVRRLGYVEDSRLPALYAAATALVMPSLYEGFGLPALEAMACGVPVIVSQGTALEEVVGQAGVLVDANNSAAIAEGLDHVVDNSELRTKLREAGLQRSARFDWRRSAEAASQFIQLVG